MSRGGALVPLAPRRTEHIGIGRSRCSNRLMILFPLLSGLSSSPQGATLEVGVDAFAATRAEFTTDPGMLDGSAAIPPVREYKRLEEWDPAEPSTSPERFDAVAVVKNMSSGTTAGVEVRIDVFAKVGRLVFYDDASADADVLKSIQDAEKQAEWSTAAFASKAFQLGTLRAGELRSTSLKNIDLKRLMDPLYAKGRWPYAIRIHVEVSCDGCRPRVAAERVVAIKPGD